MNTVGVTSRKKSIASTDSDTEKTPKQKPPTGLVFFANLHQIAPTGLGPEKEARILEAAPVGWVERG